MASDAIVNELWEITNKNSDEKIEREEFEEELRTSVFAKLKEMSPDNSINNINDEYARSLPVILHQAEVNPESLGQIEGGKFTISSEIISKAVETIKYENRFIPNTDEYNQRISNENDKIDIKEVVLTAVLANEMINNFDKLSYIEKNNLWDNYRNLNRAQQINLEKANIRAMRNLSNKINNSEYKELLENSCKSAESRIEYTNDISLNKGILSSLINNNKGFQENYPEIDFSNIEITEDIISLYNEYKGKQNTRMQELIEIEQNRDLDSIEKKELEEIRHQEKIDAILNNKIFQKENSEANLLNMSVQEIGNLYEKYLNQNEKDTSKEGLNSENLPSDAQELFNEFDNNKNSKEENKLESTKKEQNDNIINKIPENEFESPTEQVAKEQFTEEEISEALNQYKEYFEEFDEETIEEIRELTPEEIIANIKDDFADMQNDGQISERTGKALDVIVENLSRRHKRYIIRFRKKRCIFRKNTK